MIFTLLSAALVAYIPGALIYRLPIGARAARAALPAEERGFWAVILSVALSSMFALGMGALGTYSYRTLVGANALVSVGILVTCHRHLLWRGAAARVTPTAVIPLLIIALGWWLYVPGSEYVMGGKDPGTYMNEGIQIAQRGSLVTHDPVVQGVPAAFRDLFFPSYHVPSYYSTRFMGFFLMDPSAGTVQGQFPHLYPVWIAIGYGIDGLSGTRVVQSAWAILGLLAVYFVGVRLFGRPAAVAATLLLAVNVIQVWYGRYPNAEVVMQALLFAAILAWSRADADGQTFFAPIAAMLLCLLLFLRFDTVLAFGGVAVAIALGLPHGRRPHWTFLLTLVLGSLLAGWYLFVQMRPYTDYPLIFARSLDWWQWLVLALGATLLAALAVGATRWPALRRADAWLPSVVSLVAIAFVVYAYFFRGVGGRTAWHDAMALRTFAWYIMPAGVGAALIGYVLATRTLLRRDPFFLATLTIFAGFFFYKIKIVPEHFWMTRRFLPVILPGALLLIGYAAFGGLSLQRLSPDGGRTPDGRALARTAIGIVLVALLAWQYWAMVRPLRGHIEYEGLIPRLEGIARRFGERDLILVESRAASDMHVLALPLAYIYAKPVLVLSTRRPDPELFKAFLAWARTQYDAVYFMGGGGTDLLSRTVAIQPVTSDRFQIPEWESPVNALPRGLRHKEFDYTLYRFTDAAADTAGAAAGPGLDVGVNDDLNVVRFHAKERDQHGTTFRWTRDVSYVSLLGVTPETREIALVLNDGHRPKALPQARVQVSLDDRLLGEIVVQPDFHRYTLAIPPEVAKAASASDAPARLKLVTNVWTPRAAIGTPDDRDLGVMVDRIEIR